MYRISRWAAFALLFVAVPGRAADAQYSIKLANSSLPKELHQSIAKVLGEGSVQLVDDKGGVVCELWFRKDLPVKATPAQLSNGLTYRELEETTLVGAVRYDQQATDYRKQKIKPGVYTLRLGFQPMDGDHMGTAPYGEFCLLVPAKLDEKTDVIDAKELRELSAKAIGGSHPGVLLLFPNEKPEETPKLVSKGNNTWVLTMKEPVSVDGKKVPEALGIGLTLVGQTTAE
jgi:hypothetical protein